LKLADRLGNGEFGVVYKGHYSFYILIVNTITTSAILLWMLIDCLLLLGKWRKLPVVVKQMKLSQDVSNTDVAAARKAFLAEMNHVR
jgi:hypothetical protein